MIIVLYGMMTGFAVSAIRAIAMFLLQMLAQILGRTYDRITALAVAAGLYQLRRKAGSKVDALLPEQEASVMKTMLLGEKGILDEEIKGLYQRNGIAHILAISGLHISMIGMGLYQLLRRAG